MCRGRLPREIVERMPDEVEQPLLLVVFSDSLSVDDMVFRMEYSIVN